MSEKKTSKSHIKLLQKLHDCKTWRDECLILQEAFDHVRDEAIEECEDVADNYFLEKHPIGHFIYSEDISDEIHKLKSKGEAK